MAIMVPNVVAYLDRADMEINVPKSSITAMDKGTGQRVVTDSITLHGEPCPVVPFNQSPVSLPGETVRDLEDSGALPEG